MILKYIEKYEKYDCYQKITDKTIRNCIILITNLYIRKVFNDTEIFPNDRELNSAIVIIKKECYDNPYDPIIKKYFSTIEEVEEYLPELYSELMK